MKNFYKIFLWGFILVYPLFTSQAQNDDRKFFQKGATYFTLNQNLEYSFLNLKFDGNDIGEEYSFNSRLSWNRGVSDNIGVGATDRGDHVVFKDNQDFRQVNTGFTGSVGAAFAFQVGTKQLITDLQVGYGQTKNKTENGSSTTEFKDDLFLARLKVGYPIQLYQSDLYFVPNAGYRYKTQSGDNLDVDTRSILLGLDLYASIPCNGWWYNEGVDLSRDFRYTPGTQMWGSGTKLRVNLGDITNKLSGGGEFGENQNRFSTRLDYSYYIANGFAIGFKANLNSDTRSQDDSDFKFTTSEWNVTPRLRWHPFKEGAWNDVYIEGGGGFGSNKVKTENGSSNESKQNIVLAHGGIGKFVALTPNLFLNPTIQYTWNSSKDPEDSDDLKLEQSGVRVAVGLNYSF